MPPSETEGKANQQPAAGSRIVPFVAVALPLMWIASLIAMAIWASNPVTLNRQQILRALDEGLVLRARVIDLETGHCEAIEQWPAAEPGNTFQVTNLEQTAAQPGATYLLPLLQNDGGYVVAPSMLPGENPLVYPDTPDAIAQLEELLRE